MAENSRKDPRAKVLSMTVRYKSATLDEFIEHHSHDVSRGGMYIKTPQPFPPGTLLKFEVKIAADQRVMQGVGRVVWRRQVDEATETHPAGMGVKFIKLDDESKAIISQLVAARVSETSAFDEVSASHSEPVKDSTAPSEAAPPPAARDSVASSGNFFPSLPDDDVPMPAPEDRTMMKQAAELLREALKEVGTTTADSAPPDTKRHSVSSMRSAQTTATSPAPSAGRGPERPSPERSGADTSQRVPRDKSTVDEALAEATTEPKQPLARPVDVGAKDKPSGARAQPQPAPRKITPVVTRTPSEKAGPVVRPASVRPAAKVAPPTPSKSAGGGGKLIGGALFIVAVAAGVAFTVSRKTSAPSASATQSSEPVSASAAQSPSGSPSALVANSIEPEPSAAPSAAVSAQAAAIPSAAPENPPAAAQSANSPEPPKAEAKVVKQKPRTSAAKVPSTSAGTEAPATGEAPAENTTPKASGTDTPAPAPAPEPQPKPAVETPAPAPEPAPAAAPKPAAEEAH